MLFIFTRFPKNIVVFFLIVFLMPFAMSTDEEMFDASCYRYLRCYYYYFIINSVSQVVRESWQTEMRVSLVRFIIASMKCILDTVEIR